MKNIILKIVLLFVIQYVYCQIDKGEIINEQTLLNKKPLFFYENEGIVCMKAIHAQFNYGWIPTNGVSGQAMMADSSMKWKGGVLRFEIEFTQPGNYSLYILAHKARTHGGMWGANDVKVWINRDLTTGLPVYDIRSTAKMEGLMHGDGTFSHPDPHRASNKIESEINMAQNNDFRWINTPKDGPAPAWWVVKDTGKHHIEFVVGDEWGFVIDKVYLTLNNAIPPSGIGPAETIEKGKSVIIRGLDTNLILPPAWAFGVMYGAYLNQEESFERINEIIKHDYPIDAFWIDSYFWDCSGEKRGDGPNGYMNFTGDLTAYPSPDKLWGFLEQNKIKAGIWVWNCILEKGQEEIFKDFNNKGFFSNVYLNTSSWHNSGSNSMCGDIDFNNPSAVNYFHNKMKPLFDYGLDFVKLDRSSSIPFCKAMHMMTQKNGKETKGRGFILSHTGGVESPEFKKYPVKWSDDSKVVWSQPDYPDFLNYTFGGLKENIEFLADPSRWQYEIPFLTSDCGGFRMAKDNMTKEELDEELYLRWVQLSSFSPVMETFASLHNPTSNMAYKFSLRADSIYRYYSQLRMQLFPYIYSYAHKARWEGQKITQTDRRLPHQYYFGEEFLVAPVFEKNSYTRKVSIPEGKWINYFTNEVYEGLSEIDLNVSVETLPLFVKAGAIIPKRAYARSVELGTNNKLFVDIYANDNGYFTLYEDDGISNDYLEGKYAKTFFDSKKEIDLYSLEISAINGEYEGMSLQREYVLKIMLFQPVNENIEVKLNNKEMSVLNKKKSIGYSIIDRDKGVIELFFNANNSEKQFIEVKINKL